MSLCHFKKKKKDKNPTRFVSISNAGFFKKYFAHSTFCILSFWICTTTKKTRKDFTTCPSLQAFSVAHFANPTNQEFCVCTSKSTPQVSHTSAAYGMKLKSHQGEVTSPAFQKPQAPTSRLPVQASETSPLFNRRVSVSAWKVDARKGERCCRYLNAM